MKSKRSFVTFLGSDSFFPGLLALNESLRTYNKKYPLIVLVDKSISKKVIQHMKLKQIDHKIINHINNPQAPTRDIRNFRLTYSKLNIFRLVQFNKIVYLDSDMLVCDNIENLFEKPHMSAVIAGGMAPGNLEWKDLNSGLLVIEPNLVLYNQLVKNTNILSSIDGSDQGFLQSFFNEWRVNTSLHLDHKYNIPNVYLDCYCDLHDFEFSYFDRKLKIKNISVIHYWGMPKPWHLDIESLSLVNPSRVDQSILLWWEYYNKSFESEVYKGDRN